MAIDQVHTDGALPPINVIRGAPSPDLQGEFNPVARTLLVADRALNPKTTLWHESGHLLDFYGIGTPTAYASSADSLLDSWRAAVRQSQAHQDWMSLAQTTSSSTVSLRILLYYTEPSELWARSYAQYIATKANDPDALRHLQQLRHHFASSEVVRYQWSGSDFEPILDEIDSIFRKLLWLR